MSSRRLLANDVDDVIDGHDTHHAALAVDDWQGEEIEPRDQAGDVLLRLVQADANQLGLHEIAQPAVGVGHHQLPQRHDAGQAVLAVHHVDVEHRLSLPRPPQVLQGFRHRARIRQRKVMRGHEAAGRARIIRQQPVDLGRKRLGQLMQHFRQALRGHLAEDVGGVVRRQKLDHGHEAGGGEMRHHGGARLLVEIGEHRGGKGRVGQALQQFALLAERHVMEDVGALAAVQLAKQAHQIGVCLTAQQAAGRLHRQRAMGCHFPRLGRWGSIHEIGSGACYDRLE